ncbi:MAG TPA: response regulator [Pyrinomonadaceae bacterium]|nr:response regulator [Pyrinomonadaceae bacterium]
MQENYTITKGARISIVDDDESMREAVKALIASMGLSAEDFSSAEAFLNSGRSQAFDCLILDVRMPGLSGLELQRRLAADDCPIPIVFMTALYVEDVRTKAMEAGAVDFLRKPFTEKELVNAIGKSLALHKTIGEGSDEPRN